MAKLTVASGASFWDVPLKNFDKKIPIPYLPSDLTLGSENLSLAMAEATRVGYLDRRESRTQTAEQLLRALATKACNEHKKHLYRSYNAGRFQAELQMGL